MSLPTLTPKLDWKRYLNEAGKTDVTFVTRGAPLPILYESTTGADGGYRMDEVQPGRYTVLLTAGRDAAVKALPERYALTTSSPLVVDVKPGGDTLDFVLQ